MCEDFDYLKVAEAVVLCTFAISAGILFGHYATVADSGVPNTEIVTNTEVVKQPQDINVNVDIHGDNSIAGWGTLLLTAGSAITPAAYALHKRNKVRKEVDKLKL